MIPRTLQLLAMAALLPLTAAEQEDAARQKPAHELLSQAWQSADRENNLPATAQFMMEFSGKEDATLAAAVLAEYQLCIMGNADAPALATLRELAPDFPDLAWLEAEQLRLRGELDTAAAACREIETNHANPTLVRQRARLILADIYYAKEEEARKAGDGYTAVQAPAPAKNVDVDEEDDETPQEETLQTLEGKGEETLLSFITANPNSPLLEEAFRRLKSHRAFETSEYARTALNEWVQDTAEHKRRAALALGVLQHLLNRDDQPDAPVDTSCAATAANALPQEPATARILLDQMRSLYLRGRVDDARALLATLPETFPSDETAAAAKVWRLLLEDPQGDWNSLLKVKHSAELDEVIRHNASLGKLSKGEEIVLNSPQLCLLFAQFILSENSDTARLERARAALQRIIDNSQADAASVLHARILLADITARSNPQHAIEQLHALRTGANALPPKLVGSYFRVLENAHRAVKTPEEASECIIAELQGVYPLRMHLASLMVLSRNHREEAIKLLKKIVAENPRGDNEPQALLLLAECTAQGDTIAALKEAAAIYDRAAARADKPTAQQARIRKAAILVRIGNINEAERDMRAMLSKESPAPREELMARIVLSNALVLGGSDERREESMRCLEEMVDTTLTDLPREWQFMLLQTHATRCLRLGENERAMRSLNTILEMQPAQAATSPYDSEWAVLYHASANAVQALLALKQYKRAADIAESTANCNTSLAPDERPQGFLQWAAEIRQEHVSSAPASANP